MSCRFTPSRLSFVSHLHRNPLVTTPSTSRRMASTRQDAKKELRSQIKARLSGLTAEEISNQSGEAQDAIFSLSQYKDAKRIGIYLAMPTAEAQTDKLVRDALTAGKLVYVPHIHAVGTEKPKRKIMDMLRLESLEEYQGLERDSWGIPKLPKEKLEARENAMGGVGLTTNEDSAEGLDLIIVPGVAFDREMNRMGHGAGFYDAFLTRFCADSRRPRPFLVGLCLAEQIVPPGQIVMQDWDWKVDAVAVGNGSLLRPKDA